MLKFTLILLSAGLAWLPLTAGVLPFRSGEILAAELSNTRPALRNVPDELLKQYSRPCYALVVVQVTSGRSLSRYDYQLNVFGRKYPCVALQRGSGAFDADQWELSGLSPQERCGMLFILDGSSAGIDNVETFRLAAAAPGTYPETAVPFLNKRSAPLSAAEKIPANGVMPPVKP